MQPPRAEKQHITLAELKRSSKSFEAIQEALVLCLLNINGVGFKARRPERRSQKTLQFLMIEELFDGVTTSHLENDVEALCNEHVSAEFQESSISNLQPADIETISRIPSDQFPVERLKQIKRHKDANRVALLFNSLLERAEKLGYHFKMRTTKPSRYTVKMHKICGVSGPVLLMLDQITEIGKQVNAAVFARFEKITTIVTIPPYDKEVTQIYEHVCKQTVGTPMVLDDVVCKMEETSPREARSLGERIPDHSPPDSPMRCLTEPFAAQQTFVPAQYFFANPPPLFHSRSESDLEPTYSLDLTHVHFPSFNTAGWDYDSESVISNDPSNHFV